jgi:hypothetical protein
MPDCPMLCSIVGWEASPVSDAGWAEAGMEDEDFFFDWAFGLACLKMLFRTILLAWMLELDAGVPVLEAVVATDSSSLRSPPSEAVALLGLLLELAAAVPPFEAVVPADLLPADLLLELAAGVPPFEAVVPPDLSPSTTLAVYNKQPL